MGYGNLHDSLANPSIDACHQAQSLWCSWFVFSLVRKVMPSCGKRLLAGWVTKGVDKLSDHHFVEGSPVITGAMSIQASDLSRML